MNKYDRLRDYLIEQDNDELQLSLIEIETILGEPLPGSAELSQWWCNARSARVSAPRVPAWEAAGFVARHLRGSSAVVFCRGAS